MGGGGAGSTSPANRKRSNSASSTKSASSLDAFLAAAQKEEDSRSRTTQEKEEENNNKKSRNIRYEDGENNKNPSSACLTNLTTLPFSHSPSFSVAGSPSIETKIENKNKNENFYFSSPPLSPKSELYFRYDLSNIKNINTNGISPYSRRRVDPISIAANTASGSSQEIPTGGPAGNSPSDDDEDSDEESDSEDEDVSGEDLGTDDSSDEDAEESLGNSSSMDDFIATSDDDMDELDEDEFEDADIEEARNNPFRFGKIPDEEFIIGPNDTERFQSLQRGYLMRVFDFSLLSPQNVCSSPLFFKILSRFL